MSLPGIVSFLSSILRLNSSPFLSCPSLTISIPFPVFLPLCLGSSYFLSQVMSETIFEEWTETTGRTSPFP